MKAERLQAEIYGCLEDCLWKLEEMCKIIDDEEIERKAKGKKHK